MKKVVLGVAILAVGCNALAAPTAELRVTGTIIPGACDVNLTGGSTVDYGTFKQVLQKNTPTALPKKNIDYNIVCDAPTLIGLVLKDNRSADSENNGYTHNYGLGRQGANMIGNYTVLQLGEKVRADGAPAALIATRNETTEWTSSSSTFFRPDATLMQGFSSLGSNTPTPFSTYSGTFEIEPKIAPGITLNANAGIELDGSATLEIVYL